MATVIFSAWYSVLSIPVFHVVIMCTGPQVGGVATSRIIAGMAYEHTIGDRSMSQDVGDPMGVDASFVNNGSAIPPFIHGTTKPSPTFIWSTFVNTFPE